VRAKLTLIMHKWWPKNPIEKTQVVAEEPRPARQNKLNPIEKTQVVAEEPTL
jgi:hypothetical protein